MNKFLLLATLALGAQTANAQLQHSFTPAGKPLTIATGEEAVPEGKTTATGSRVIADAGYNYVTAQSAFEAIDSTTYVYSGDRTGEGGGDIMYDTSVYMSISGGVSTPSARYLIEYNTANQPIHESNQGWNGTNWYNDARKDSYYDANGFLVTDTTMAWDNGTSAYRYNNCNVYTTNAAGKPTIANSYSYSMGTQSWLSYIINQYLYTYDASNNLTESIVRHDNGGTLVNTDRTVFSYNSAGKPVTAVSQVWNTVTNAWRNASAGYYSYNAANQATSIALTQWNNVQNKFDTLGRYYYTYDANGNTTELRLAAYNSGTNTYTNAQRVSYTYNSYNQRLTSESQTWEPGGGVWVYENGNSKAVYYYETFTPSVVAKMKQQGGKLMVYPVPAGNTLNVAIDWNTAQTYTLTIADMQGRIVHQSNSGNALQSVDVSMLAAGAYNIILQGSEGGLQHSRFTLVK